MPTASRQPPATEAPPVAGMWTGPFWRRSACSAWTPGACRSREGAGGHARKATLVVGGWLAARWTGMQAHHGSGAWLAEVHAGAGLRAVGQAISIRMPVARAGGAAGALAGAPAAWSATCCPRRCWRSSAARHQSCRHTAAASAAGRPGSRCVCHGGPGWWVRQRSDQRVQQVCVTFCSSNWC